MSLALYVTRYCNLNCRYCFNWESNKKQPAKSLEYQDICQILAAGREKGHQYLTLTGGEPFLYKDILKVVDYAYDLGYMINVLTNGLLVDEHIAKELHGKHRLRIRVSLEGSSKEFHEYFRGRNTFDRALHAIQIMVENNINVGIGFTVYEENLAEIENAALLCIQFGCAFVKFSPVVRILKGKQAKTSLGLHRDILTKIAETQIKYRDHVEFPGSDSVNLSLPIEAITTKRCEAGSNFFAINPEKVILPCPLIRSDAKVFRKKFTGKEDFDEVSQHIEELFDDIASNSSGSCATCEFNETCSGGCLAEKLSFGLTLYDEQPVCARRILEEVGRDLNSKDFGLLKKSWIYRINSSHEKGKDKAKFCFRQAPFWTILFRHHEPRSPMSLR